MALFTALHFSTHALKMTREGNPRSYSNVRFYNGNTQMTSGGVGQSSSVTRAPYLSFINNNFSLSQVHRPSAEGSHGAQSPSST
jgi:hypothetical protein